MNDQELELQREADLDRRMARLKRDIEPHNDLWLAIADGIDNGRRDSEKRPGRVTWLKTFAIAASLAVISSIATSWWIGRQAMSIEQDETWPGFVERVVYTTTNGTRVPGPEYVSDRTELVKALEQEISLLPEDTRYKVTRDLLEIHRALEDISQALTGDPGNVLLQRLLLAMYQEELALLDDLNQISVAVRAQRTNL